MVRADLLEMLRSTGEEITDENGTVIGYVVQPVRLRLNQPYLARGGFLVVARDESSGEYVGTEYDALPHPKTGQPYPAGHSEEVFRVSAMAEAADRILLYFPETDRT